MFEVFTKGVYGCIDVPTGVFRKLDSRYFISGCNDSVKYMCANKAETKHLKSIGANIPCDIVCDFYKVIKKDGL